MEKILMWCGSILVSAAVAISFLFMTFQTNAQSDKTAKYFDDRLSRIEEKIDRIINKSN